MPKHVIHPLVTRALHVSVTLCFSPACGGHANMTLHIDCIKEMDVTSVTSPIGLWSAAQKPIVLNLGRCMLGKNPHRFYLYGHEAGPWAKPWAERRGCYGCEGWISRTLVNQPVNQDVATP